MSYIEYLAADHEASDPLPELARTNGFTMDDLEANRKGKISEAQKSKLFARALQPIQYPGMALLGWLLCCFIVKTLVPGFVLLIISMLGFKGIGILFGAVTLVCLGSLFVAVLRSFRYLVLVNQDISNAKSAFLDGRATVSHESVSGLGTDHLHGQSRKQFWYVVQNQYFEVNEAAAAALPERGRFRIHFAPKSQLFLSMEPVPANAPAGEAKRTRLFNLRNLRSSEFIGG
ncbi:MAG: hypothetical protein IT165_05030 [Bryobacterales bacterium]|nr:hypothetical protein [Bryobacterales bacterium]